MFAQKKYEDAQPGQIREYATTFLQLDLKGTESDAEILAAVKRAQPGQEYIFVKFDEPEELQQVGGNVTAADLPDVRFVDDAARGKGTFGRNDPRCQIMIPPADTRRTAMLMSPSASMALCGSSSAAWISMFLCAYGWLLWPPSRSWSLTTRKRTIPLSARRCASPSSPIADLLTPRLRRGRRKPKLSSARKEGM
jgi:hypothetical protein